MRRRVLMSVVLALAPAAFLSVGPVVAAATLPAGAGVPGPDEPLPAEMVASQLSIIRSDLDRYREALDAGRFGPPLATDGAVFDELLTRIDALDALRGDVTFGEMSTLVFDAGTYLLELAARDGADPQLVAEIQFLVGGVPVAPVAPADVTTAPPTTAPFTAAPPTAPPTAPATTPATVPATTSATSAPTVVATTSATLPAQPATTTRAARPDDGWTFRTWLLLTIGATALFAIAGYAGERWYRARLPKPTGRPGFHDLFDVSRRLAGAGSADEVEELAVRQAVRLTGATGGAFVHHRDRRLTVGFETEAGLLLADRLRDGALDRVVGTGAEILQPSTADPAVRQAPVSLIAVPVYLAGAVSGALVLVGDAATPFDDLDLRMASDLKPIIGAAFEQVHHTQRVRAEAYADGLTGVSNRRALDIAVGELGDAPFAAVMVDLDHFKAVNDTHGHPAGDDLLRSVAARLVANVRPGDGVYRYGGEEFAVVMPHTDEAAAAEVAERVRRAIEANPFVIGPARVTHRATASLGVAAGTGGAVVFARADAALYDAKRSGRNRVATGSNPAATAVTSTTDGTVDGSFSAPR